MMSISIPANICYSILLVRDSYHLLQYDDWLCDDLLIAKCEAVSDGLQGMVAVLKGRRSGVGFQYVWKETTCWRTVPLCKESFYPELYSRLMRCWNILCLLPHASTFATRPPWFLALFTRHKENFHTWFVIRKRLLHSFPIFDKTSDDSDYKVNIVPFSISEKAPYCCTNTLEF